jgi:uncharacterized protein YodC (DUF2158 family)
MQTVPLGSTVYLKPGSPDVTVIEHNRDGTIKLALFDGTRDHYLDVPPDAVALSSERVESFKREAARQATGGA